MARGIFRRDRYFIPLYRLRRVVNEGTIDTPPPETTVIITDVDGNETWVDGDTGLIIAGSGFVGP